MNVIKTSARLCTYVLLFCTLPLYANIIHVSKSGTPNGTGQSWADAIDEFVQAIAVAQDGDTIYIAAGTYLLPYEDRLWITQRLYIYGGFAGWESSIEERIVDTNVTIISGNQLYSKIVVKDVQGFFVVDGLHFVNGMGYFPLYGPPPDSLWYVPFGGIIQIFGPESGEALALSITNCTFKDNFAANGGAAAIHYGDAGGSIKIKQCLFESNFSWHEGYSGALKIDAAQLPKCQIEIDSCRFIANNAVSLGFSCIDFYIDSVNDHDTVIISNCVFENNWSGKNSFGTIGFFRPLTSEIHPYILLKNCRFENNRSYTANIAGSKLGGLALFTSNIFQVNIDNCSFLGNNSNGYGLLYGYSFDVQNSLFSNNYSKDGGTVYYDNSPFVRPSRKITRFSNCTFTNNLSQGPGALFLKNGPISHFEMNNCVSNNNSSEFHPSMFYSRTADTSYVIPPQISYIGGDIEPAFFHFNEETDNWILNTDSLTWYIGDPRFVDTLANDFRLKRCSPFINKGFNAFVTGNDDLGGNSRILEDTVDLGAFERLRFIPEIDLLSATCAHNPDGEILLLPGGYTPPALWNIIDEMGTAHENEQLTPGTYEATMLDGEDCEAIFDIIISGPDTIKAWFEVTGAPAASPMGSIMIDSINGGVPGYKIQWFDGSSELSLIGLSPGFYTVTITDEVGCERVWEIEVPLINNVSIPNALGHFTIVNPAGDYLEYQWDPVIQLLYTYSLINGMGQEVASGLLVPGRQRVQLSGLPSGQYWLSVSSTDHIASYPILLVKN